MLNEIVNAISFSLSESFGGIDVHVNELKQGFEEPCFFIDLLNPSEKQIVGNRYLRSYLFDIAYFPKTIVRLRFSMYLTRCTMYLNT